VAFLEVVGGSRPLENVIQGAVIAFIDITTSKLAEAGRGWV